MNCIYLAMNVHLKLNIVDKNALEVCNSLRTKSLQLLNAIITEHSK